MSNDTNQHGLTDDELGGRLRRAAWGLSRPPSTPTARQRSVKLAAGPLARPQRRDAERRSRMSRTLTLSGSSRSSMEVRSERNDLCGPLFRHLVLDIVERFINSLMRVRAHLGN